MASRVHNYSAETHQEGAAFQANHDVGEFWDGGGTEAYVRHVLLHLENTNRYRIDMCGCVNKIYKQNKNIHIRTTIGFNIVLL